MVLFYAVDGDIRERKARDEISDKILAYLEKNHNGSKDDISSAVWEDIKDFELEGKKLNKSVYVYMLGEVLDSLQRKGTIQPATYRLTGA